MTTMPLTLRDEPVGIVVRAGPLTPHPKIWAYLWAAEDEDAKEHLHERLPAEKPR